MLASELTEVLIAPAPREPAAASHEPAAAASRPEERGNAIETRIAEIWHGLLGTSLGLHDNFFEKGADSLALLSLTARIRDTWQVELPLRRVLEEPTVAQLAAQIGGELDRRAATARARETSRTLVEIQAGRPEKVPFFTVHAAGGNVLCYYNLARHLGGDRPVYALQAPGVEQGEEEIFTRLEDLAAHHVAAVRTLRPHGPYLLVWQSKVALGAQGRVFAMRGMAATLSLPLSSLLAGPLADRIFNPLLVEGGPLAASFGRLIGTGPGRGIGLMFILFGAALLATTLLGAADSRLRRVESDLPEAPLGDSDGDPGGNSPSSRWVDAQGSA